MNGLSLSMALATLTTGFVLIAACHDPIMIGDEPGSDGGSDGSLTAKDGSTTEDTSTGPRPGTDGGPVSCVRTSDCPVTTEASCAVKCADGIHPCFLECIEGQCAIPGCPDAGAQEASIPEGGAPRTTDASEDVSTPDTGTPQTPDASCIVLRASDYDQSCSADTDCVLVFEGMICSGPGCFCPSAGINVQALPRYGENRGGIDATNICDCGLAGALHCLAGQCVVVRSSAGDAGSE